MTSPRTYVTRTKQLNGLPVTRGAPYAVRTVAKIGFTDLQIGDVVDVHGAVEVTSERSHAIQFSRAIKVAGKDQSPSLSIGDVVCRPMSGANLIDKPSHHAMLNASGFYTVHRNGTELAPHVFLLVVYVASTAVKQGETVKVEYVEMHIKVTKNEVVV